MLMQALAYVNMLLILTVMGLYYYGVRRNKGPYRPIKIAMIFCMGLSFFNYTQLTTPGELFFPGGEAIFVRVSYGLLLLCLCAFGLVGLNRKKS
jgi:hypothetical protein